MLYAVLKYTTQKSYFGQAMLYISFFHFLLNFLRRYREAAFFLAANIDYLHAS